MLVDIDEEGDGTMSHSRCEFKMACDMSNVYYIADPSIEEDLEETKEEDHGVIRTK